MGAARREPIAIIGIGCRFPGGARTPDGFWHLLCNGTNAISEISPDRWNISGFFDPEPGKPGKTYSKWAGLIDFIDQFDPQFFNISPREAMSVDPQQRLLLEATWEAMEDAGQQIDFCRGSRTGVYVGISMNDYAMLQAAGDMSSIDAYTATGSTLSIAANRISYAFNFHGPSCAIDTACSSSLVAVHLACRALRDHECEMAIAAGVNVIAGPFGFIVFSSMGMLSPDGCCKAFDARANGFVRGEGVGAIVLKPLSAALADQDKIYALICGSAVNQDGRTQGITVPSQESQQSLMTDACRDAGIRPATVQYVEAHGTGTPVGDPIEAAAIGAAMGRHHNRSEGCMIGSVKTNIGHLEAAAGIASVIKVALALQHGEIPPSLHLKQPNPRIDFETLKLRVSQERTRFRNGQTPIFAGVNSFGWGGTNAHVLLRALPPYKPPRRAREYARPRLLPISGRSHKALASLARKYVDLLQRRDDKTSLRDICYSAAFRRSHLEYRIAVTGCTKKEIANKIEELSNDDSTQVSQQTIQPNKIAFVFSGQGAQWWAMGRQLLNNERVFREEVKRCDRLVREIAGWSVLSELSASKSWSRLTQTAFAQPTIFTLQVALAALWRSWGIRPDAVVGHSVGEIAAVYEAGVFDLRTAIKIVFHRARCMEQARGQGSMLAVGLAAKEADEFISSHPNDVCLAAINSPSSITLSGNSEALTEICAELRRQKVFTKFVPVNYAFHSFHMDPMELELRSVFNTCKPSTARIKIVSTVTGRVARGDEFDSAYWWHNVRSPVQFSPAIAKLIDEGCGVFIEINAHPVLAASIRECAAYCGKRCAVLHSLKRGVGDITSMLTSLSVLYGLGYHVNWHALFPHGGRYVDLPRHPMHRERFWNEPQLSKEARLQAPPHPFLAHRIHSRDLCWEVKLDKRTFLYLQDHRVHGRAIFPAAAFIEAALALAREVFGQGIYVIEDIDFLQALFLPDADEHPTLQIIYYAQDSSFVISSRPSEEILTWTTHATGKIRLGTAENTDGLVEIELVRQRCKAEGAGAKLYQLLFEGGIHYGPSFHGVKKFWRRDLEVIAQVRIPGRIAKEARKYLIHPAYLDLCFQPSFVALSSQRFDTSIGTFLPVHVDRVRFLSTPRPVGWMHGNIRRVSLREYVGDARLLTFEGKVCVEVLGLREAFVESARRELNDCLYEMQWHVKALPEIIESRSVEYLPRRQRFAQRLQKGVERLRNEYSPFEGRKKFYSHLDALCSGYFLVALRKLGWKGASYGKVHTPTLVQQLGISSRFEPLIRRLIRRFEGRSFPGNSFDAGVTWRSLLNRVPALSPELTMIERSGRQLASVLRGDTDPGEMVFPCGSANALDHLYSESLLFRIRAALIRRILTDISCRVPVGRNLRILELNGGSAVITQSLLRCLPTHRVDYVFSDVCDTLFPEAQRKLQDFPHVRYSVLEVERPPAKQGFELSSTDVILAATGIFPSSDADAQIASLRTLLVPGGVLLSSTWERIPMWFDFVFGLLNPNFLVMSGRQWQKELTRHGFEDPLFLDAVVLARAPFTKQRIAPPLPKPDKQIGRWLILADEGGVAAKLASLFRERGDLCTLVPFDRKAKKPHEMRRLWFDFVAGRRVCGVVHLWSIDDACAAKQDAEAIDAAQWCGCLSVLHLVQAIEHSAISEVPPLSIVTRGAQPAGDRANQVRPTHAPLVGLARVIRTEHPHLRCRVVDLDPRGSLDEANRLFAELIAEEVEEEVALRGETRYVQRIGHGFSRLQPDIGNLVSPQRQPCRLEVGKPGLLDQLVVRPLSRRKPKCNEVEIEVVAAGLNFRDVMKALGVYPTETEDAMILGDECAGRIISVGKHVRHLRRGDEVIAVAPGCFASHVITDAALVLPKPSGLTFEEAATLLIARLTAYYALHHVGRIQRGERVLIHAATGGVGLAAVQLAQRAGAEIFATAGTTEKRDFLRIYGIQHVMDSRSLAFVDEVMQITNGNGVDLILNSLAGEAIPKGLTTLAAGGRFLEIGKRDIYLNSKLGLGPFRNNLSFFAIDLSQAMQPGLFNDFVGRHRDKFDAETLRPLPHRCFPLREAVSGFRHMAEARQVGKVVISVRGEDVAIEQSIDSNRAQFHRNGTYLIVGGLGGFGLFVAQWMALKGAGHLVLMNRSCSLTGKRRQALKAIQTAGAKVWIMRGDVTRERDLRRVLKRISGNSPPLRGIIHAAMVIDDGTLLQLNAKRFQKVLAPKVCGSWNLHKLTADYPLDFFVLFSSAAAVIGSPGQGNYVAANSFLDALAHYRHALGLPALAINWGLLTEVGYVARNPKLQEHFARLGWSGMTPRKAVQALGQLLPTQIAQMAVAQIDWSNLPKQMTDAARYELVARETGLVDNSPNKPRSIREDVINATPTKGREIIQHYLHEQIAKALRVPVEEVRIDKPLTELGLDSLMAVELIIRVEEQLGTSTPRGRVTAETIAKLSAVLLKVITGANAPILTQPFNNMHMENERS